MTSISLKSYCGGVFQTNGYLFTGSDGRHWLFDAPEGVAHWLQQGSIQPEGLILTHQHHDHVMDAAKVVETFHCPVYAWAEPDESLTLSKNLERMMGVPCPIEPYPVTHVLQQETRLTLGEHTWDLLHVPGHSPDSLCFHLAGSSLLIGGDVLFYGSIGRTDLPHGDHELLLSGIRQKLFALDDDTQVFPGHGPATSIVQEKHQNPFVGQGA